MAGLNLQTLLLSAEAALETGWREVIAALPAKLRRQFATGPAPLALPDSAYLVRRIELPLLSRFNLAALMRFEAPRHIPLPLSEACFDFRIASRDLKAGRMVVELAIMRAGTLRPALAAARDAGLHPEAVLVPTQGTAWLSRRLAGQDWRAALRTPRLQRQFLRFAIPAACLLALVLGAQDWSARLAAARDGAVAAARAQAGDVVPVRAALLALNDSLAYLAAQRARPSAAQTAEEVARLLPDDAYLQELDIEPGTVRLLGVSRSATGLLRVFSASALFSNPEFEAPLTPSPGGAGDEFDLVMSRN